jgi:RNB domain
MPALCSLRADVERLAFSVIWEMTPDAQPLSTTFTKSIIRSRAALTYEAAQNRIDGPDDGDEVTAALRLLMCVAKILRRQRCASSLQTSLSGQVARLFESLSELCYAGARFNTPRDRVDSQDGPSSKSCVRTCHQLRPRGCTCRHWRAHCGRCLCQRVGTMFACWKG